MTKKQMKIFFKKLAGQEGCNFRPNPTAENPKDITWECDGAKCLAY